jgi:hypothetical protein
MMKTRFGAHLLPLREFKTWDDLQDAQLRALCRALDIGNMVALVGAGMSHPYGFPTWHKLACGLVEELRIKATVPNDFMPPLTEIEKDYLKHVCPELICNGQAANINSLLDYCHRLYFRRGRQAEFSALVAKYFNKKPVVPTERPSSLEGVVNLLNVRRFATFNYERVLADVLKEKTDLRESFLPILNGLDACFADLVSFALGGGNYRSGILHLHGQIQPELGEKNARLVLTESQYQDQYMSHGARERRKRDAYRLLLANSILFVGFSLEDEDVLRPFRQFVADNAINGRHRPWFALLTVDEDKAKRKHELFHHYYYRYGIRTLFIEYKHENEITRRFIRKLHEIRAEWVAYRQDRTRPPAARAPRFGVVRPNNQQDKEKNRLACW